MPGLRNTHHGATDTCLNAAARTRSRLISHHHPPHRPTWVSEGHAKTMTSNYPSAPPRPSRPGSTQTQRAPTPHSETKTGEEGMRGGGGAPLRQTAARPYGRGGGAPRRVWDYRYAVHATQGIALTVEGGEKTTHVHARGWRDRRRQQEALFCCCS